MSTINYNITEGTPPITVVLQPGGSSNLHTVVPSTGYFTNLEDNTDYTLSFFDSSVPTCTLEKRVYMGTENCINYGYLYNAFTVRTTGNLSITSSPAWIIPSDAEWTTLINYLIANGYNYDGTTSGNKIGKALAAASGWLYWATEGCVGNTDYPEYKNKAKMNMVPSVYRNKDGTFYTPPVTEAIGAIYWSTTLQNYSGVDYNRYTDIGNRQIDFVINNATFNEVGGSIRLVKNFTNLNHGESGQYVGNDGKKYRTICLGTQEWLADNLAETLYRDLSSIPEITDDLEWSELTTGARCALSNQSSYVECQTLLSTILLVGNGDNYVSLANNVSIDTPIEAQVGNIMFLCASTTDDGDITDPGDGWIELLKTANSSNYNSWGVWYKVVEESDLEATTTIYFENEAKVYASKSVFSGKEIFPFISTGVYNSLENSTTISPTLSDGLNNGVILCFYNIYDANHNSGRSVSFTNTWTLLDGQNSGNYWHTGSRYTYQTTDGASELLDITSTLAIDMQTLIVQILPNYL